MNVDLVPLCRRVICTLFPIIFGSIVGGVLIDMDHPIAMWLSGENPTRFEELCAYKYNSISARFLHIPILFFSSILLFSGFALLVGRMSREHS